jgi:hypothetical protein
MVPFTAIPTHSFMVPHLIKPVSFRVMFLCKKKRTLPPTCNTMCTQFSAIQHNLHFLFYSFRNFRQSCRFSYKTPELTHFKSHNLYRTALHTDISLKKSIPNQGEKSNYFVPSTHFHVAQTGSGVHPASYPMGTGGKAAGA